MLNSAFLTALKLTLWLGRVMVDAPNDLSSTIQSVVSLYVRAIDH